MTSGGVPLGTTAAPAVEGAAPDSSAPDPATCDHKFIDSPACLKCGWTPQPDDEMPPATLQRLLSKAGADITLEQIVAWSQAARAGAGTWATAQIDAAAHAKPGHSVSVKWPTHVSDAHHERFTLKKRKGRTTR